MTGRMVIFDAGGMVVDAALAGVGIGYVLEDRALDEFKSGALVRLLADWCPPFPGFYLSTTRAGVSYPRRSPRSSTRPACQATRESAADY